MNRDNGVAKIMAFLLPFQQILHKIKKVRKSRLQLQREVFRPQAQLSNQVI